MSVNVLLCLYTSYIRCTGLPFELRESEPYEQKTRAGMDVFCLVCKYVIVV